MCGLFHVKTCVTLVAVTELLFFLVTGILAALATSGVALFVVIPIFCLLLLVVGLMLVAVRKKRPCLMVPHIILQVNSVLVLTWIINNAPLIVTKPHKK